MKTFYEWGGKMGVMRVLNSRNLAVRIVFLWLMGVLLMFAAWGFSYRSLPEGAVRGKFFISYVKINTVKVIVTFTQIFTWNLLLAGLPIVLANLVRVKALPLGYLLSLYHWLIYGIFLGTNSFVFPSPIKLAPTLQIFRSTAVYEITSYTIIAASTYGIKIHQMGKRRGWRLTWRLGGLRRGEAATFISAVIILGLSNYIEALQLVGLQ